MDKKYIKRFIEDCPLTNFSDEGNVQEREVKLSEYLDKATEYININEEELARAFWEENFVKSQVVIFKKFPFFTKMPCFS